MESRVGEAGSGGAPPGARGLLRWFLKPAAWLFYFIIVFEILFMVSPIALQFYSAYGPALNLLHGSSSTAWLTRFYLPHFSQTSSPVLNSLRPAGFVLVLAGGGLFLACAIPLYLAKIFRAGAVTGGFYRIVRHPQYVMLAIVGLGTCLVWPRTLAAVTYVSMICAYFILARWEEEICLARFGDAYRDYRERTGMFLPRALEERIPKLIPAAGAGRVIVGLAIYAVAIGATLALASGLQRISLSKVSGFYTDDAAVLSPARLTDREVRGAYETAIADGRVRDAIGRAGAGKRIVYVVPSDWRLPDLPMDAGRHRGGHFVPPDFDRERYKVLFTRVRTHHPEAGGREIVRRAYGRDPIILVNVDIAAAEVRGIARPPPHVRWGDIPTPMF